MAEENNIPKVYDPAAVEKKWYAYWIEQGFFHQPVDKSRKPFSVVIPPPNITGKLHMGHALDNTLQDILVRWHRMMGDNTCWLPGYDHAGLATQIKVEEELKKKEGLTRYDLGREEFVKRVWKWKEAYGDEIVRQLKSLGISCDWDRQRFTMDEGLSRAVREAFVSLYEKGLIYKGTRMINWCVNCRTALSDVEVEHQDDAGALWYINYPIVGEKDQYLTIATSRPETIPGDTAVAVNPKDERYGKLVGKKIALPTTNREIPIIADEYVDLEFGTGAVKITPAHDPNDYEVGQRHNLEQIVVIGLDGKMTREAGKYEGEDRYECRKHIVQDLKDMGLLVKIEDAPHSVGHCQRCHHVVEPMVSTQWFVKMKPLAEAAIKCVTEGHTEFVPSRFTKTYLQWMENIHDWCISRQIWWGHRIPVWYCDDCGEVAASRTDLTACPKCGSTHIHQEEDCLDTWFSSGLWPFSTFGWPDKTEELEHWYPTSVLVTGYDIIFFWVARMITMGEEFMGKEPFKHVFIHGLVRDEQGRKMSKSLGNGIDPIEVIEKYGADALRFTLVTGNSPGNDMRFTEEKLESSRNFANKIWNAARFIHMNIDGFDVKNELPESLTLEDQWIVSALNTVTKEVTENLEKYELGIAVQKLYDFIWDQFCDWYIELAKTRLMAKDETSVGARQVLVWTFTSILKLMHPFMPYITEEIWQTMPHEGEALMAADYPKYNEKYAYPQAETEMHRIMEVIRAIRNRRAEMNVPPSRRAKVYVASSFEETFRKGAQFVARLAYASEVEVGEAFSIPGAVTIVTADAKVYIPMDELVDKEAELKRLNKELETAQKQLDQVNAKLNNPGFTGKAPANVVEGARQNAQKLEDKIKMIASSIEALNG